MEYNNPKPERHSLLDHTDVLLEEVQAKLVTGVVTNDLARKYDDMLEDSLGRLSEIGMLSEDHLVRIQDAQSALMAYFT